MRGIGNPNSPAFDNRVGHRFSVTIANRQTRALSGALLSVVSVPVTEPERVSLGFVAALVETHDEPPAKRLTRTRTAATERLPGGRTLVALFHFGVPPAMYEKPEQPVEASALYRWARETLRPVSPPKRRLYLSRFYVRLAITFARFNYDRASESVRTGKSRYAVYEYLSAERQGNKKRAYQYFALLEEHGLIELDQDGCVVVNVPESFVNRGALLAARKRTPGSPELSRTEGSRP